MLPHHTSMGPSHRMSSQELRNWDQTPLVDLDPVDQATKPPVDLVRKGLSQLSHCFPLISRVRQ